jgi:hypothetical protein
MSTIFWILTKVAILIALLWASLMVFATFGIDLVLRGSIGTEDLGTGLFFTGVLAIALGLLINPNPLRARRAARDPNAELAITTPLSLICGMVLGSVLVASSCTYVLVSGTGNGMERGMAIAGLLVCVSVLVGVPFHRRTNLLKLSPRGLNYSGFGCGPIAWRDITVAEVEYVWRSWVVTLHVRNEENYIQAGLKGIGVRRRWLRRVLWSPLSIPSLMFNVSPEWLRRVIQVRIDHFGITDAPNSAIA